MTCSVCDKKIKFGEKYFNETVATENGNKTRILCMDCLLENCYTNDEREDEDAKEI